MTSEETINLLKTISESVDRLASFKGGKEDEKSDTIKNEDDKLSSTLSTTEKRRWETMSKILAKSIKEIVFPKGEEKIGRPEFKSKQAEDLVLSPTFAKIQDASNKWLKMILGALALVGGIIAGVIAEITKIFRGIKAFIADTKLGKFISGIFESLKVKFLEFIKPLRESKIGKFVENILKEKIMAPIGKLFETIGRLFRVFEGGKGPLFMMKAFPTLFKFFGDYIGIIFKAFQFGTKIGRAIGKFAGPVGTAIMAIVELITGLYQAFSDPKLSDKSFFQKLVTGFTQGILNFFDFFEIFGLDIFNFDTIRDRIEAIFKPFREGKWLEGLGQILNQLISISLATGGKIFGWIVGWFSKDLGAKITKFWDRFDLFKLASYSIKRFIKIFQVIAKRLKPILDKLQQIIKPILKILGGPFFMAFQLMKKAFELSLPVVKWIGSVISKIFIGIKNLFVMIWDSIKWVANKIGSLISKIPGMGTIADELKAIATEAQVTEMPTPATVTSAPPETKKVAGQENVAQQNFDDFFSKQEDNTKEAFSTFGNQVENLNKTGSVNNKIAVDQLREFKTLNQKFDMLIDQLANNRNVVNNVVTQNSMNSFPQSTSVSDIRRYHRENN